MDWQLLVIPMAAHRTHSFQAHSRLAFVGLLLLPTPPGPSSHPPLLSCLLPLELWTQFPQAECSLRSAPSYPHLSKPLPSLGSTLSLTQHILKASWIPRTPNNFIRDPYSVYTDRGSQISWLRVWALTPDSTSSWTDCILTRNVLVSDCCYNKLQ